MCPTRTRVAAFEMHHLCDCLSAPPCAEPKAPHRVAAGLGVWWTSSRTTASWRVVALHRLCASEARLWSHVQGRPGVSPASALRPLVLVRAFAAHFVEHGHQADQDCTRDEAANAVDAHASYDAHQAW